jgi:hypothetical protein
MKNINLYLLLSALLCFCGCNELEVIEPTLQITAANAAGEEKTEFKVNEPITFNFSGQHINLVFWSGETGKDYANRAGHQAPGGVNTFSFSSNVLLAATNNQPNNLAMLVSNDFSGKMDAASIQAANWVDITSRAKWPTASNANTASGTINVSYFRSETHDTLYVAYRYKSDLGTAASKGRRWIIQNFEFKNTFPNGVAYVHNTLVTNVRNAGFQQVSLENPLKKWAIGGTLEFPAGTEEEQDLDWVISKPFALSKIPPSTALVLKEITNSVSNYVFRYSQPGTYTATFVAYNDNVEQHREVVKEITFKIGP